jgi:hypothetical protein
MLSKEERCMETVKVHVDGNNHVSFSCPHCEKTYHLPIRKLKVNKHNLVGRCKCQKRFEVLLDFRRYYRKSVKIVGEVTNQSFDSDKRYAMTVVNLSMSGLRFKILNSASINKGDSLQVQFSLDNQRADFIDKEVVVRNSGGQAFGCEFTNPAYKEKELGFYLFTH